MTIIRHTYGKKLFVVEETLAFLALEAQTTGKMSAQLRRVRDEWVKVRENTPRTPANETCEVLPCRSAG